MISAVIPAYNSEKTISETIKSLLNQDFRIEEIIVVDDGSNDKTSEIALKYPIKLFKKKHEGEASALNLGLKETKGNYIAIVEADVILPKNWASALLEELKNSKVYGVGAALECWNSASLIARLSGYELEYRYQKVPDKFVSHITSANTFYRKEVFEEVGYYDESLINACLDADLNHRLIDKGFKLVLRKDIIVKHFWKTDLFSYLKRQFEYSFYRPMMKRTILYPTDRTIVFNILLTAVLLNSIFMSIFLDFFYYLFFLSLFFIFFIQFPLILWVIKTKKDYSGLLFIFLLLFRNIAAFFGYSSGFIYNIIKTKTKI